MTVIELQRNHGLIELLAIFGGLVVTFSLVSFILLMFLRGDALSDYLVTKLFRL